MRESLWFKFQFSYLEIPFYIVILKREMNFILFKEKWETEEILLVFARQFDDGANNLRCKFENVYHNFCISFHRQIDSRKFAMKCPQSNRNN